MRNRMYGGVRGRKTKVGEKLLRFPPTRSIYSRLPAWGVLDKQEVFWRMLAPLPFASLFEDGGLFLEGGSPLPSL